MKGQPAYPALGAEGWKKISASDCVDGNSGVD